MSSTASCPQPWLSTYCGSKSFITSLALILREDIKPNGVDVMSLEPGCTWSEMIERGLKDIDTDKLGIHFMPTDKCVKEALVDFQAKPGLHRA